ncbi:MAG: DUF3078 domain-containing protein [Bacteroidota bacterium]
MKKIITLAAMLVLMSGALLNAQTTADTVKYWKVGGDVSLNFGQTALVNWSAGGVNSYSFNGLFNLHADWQKDKYLWTNNLIMAYGVYKEKDDNRSKGDDKIDFTSNFGYQMVKNWYYSTTFSFKSQFDLGFPEDQDSLFNSKFLAPAYVSLGLGLTYKPNEQLQLILAPATYRLTIVNDQRLADNGEYGVDYEIDSLGLPIPGAGSMFRHEFGFNLKFMYSVAIVKNVDFQTKLELFSNYLEEPQNIDIYWDNYFNFTINSWLSAQLTTSLIYDHDINITDTDGNTGPRTQFKQTFGLGLAYKFGHQHE